MTWPTVPPFVSVYAWQLAVALEAYIADVRRGDTGRFWRSESLVFAARLQRSCDLVSEARRACL